MNIENSHFMNQKTRHWHNIAVVLGALLLASELYADPVSEANHCANQSSSFYTFTNWMYEPQNPESKLAERLHVYLSTHSDFRKGNLTHTGAKPRQICEFALLTNSRIVNYIRDSNAARSSEDYTTKFANVDSAKAALVSARVETNEAYTKLYVLNKRLEMSLGHAKTMIDDLTPLWDFCVANAENLKAEKQIKNFKNCVGVTKALHLLSKAFTEGQEFYQEDSVALTALKEAGIELTNSVNELKDIDELKAAPIIAPAPAVRPERPPAVAEGAAAGDVLDGDGAPTPAPGTPDPDPGAAPGSVPAGAGLAGEATPPPPAAGAGATPGAQATLAPGASGSPDDELNRSFLEDNSLLVGGAALLGAGGLAAYFLTKKKKKDDPEKSANENDDGTTGSDTGSNTNTDTVTATDSSTGTDTNTDTGTGGNDSTQTDTTTNTAAAVDDPGRLCFRIADASTAGCDRLPISSYPSTYAAFTVGQWACGFRHPDTGIGQNCGQFTDENKPAPGRSLPFGFPTSMPFICDANKENCTRIAEPVTNEVKYICDINHENCAEFAAFAGEVVVRPGHTLCTANGTGCGYALPNQVLENQLVR